MRAEGEIRERLRDFIRAEILERPDYSLGNDEPLITGGLMDSFALASLAVFIEKELGVRLPDAAFTVEDMDTLDLMVARVLKSCASSRR